MVLVFQLAHYRDQPTDGTLALNGYGPPEATWPGTRGIRWTRRFTASTRGSLWPIPKRQAMCEGLGGDTSWSGGIVSLAWAQTFVAVADTPSRVDYATPDRVLRGRQ
jgi:hypothetical protein